MSFCHELNTKFVETLLVFIFKKSNLSPNSRMMCDDRGKEVVCGLFDAMSTRYAICRIFPPDLDPGIKRRRDFSRWEKWALKREKPLPDLCTSQLTGHLAKISRCFNFWWDQLCLRFSQTITFWEAPGDKITLSKIRNKQDWKILQHLWQVMWAA